MRTVDCLWLHFIHVGWSEVMYTLMPLYPFSNVLSFARYPDRFYTWDTRKCRQQKHSCDKIRVRNTILHDEASDIYLLSGSVPTTVPDPGAVLTRIPVGAPLTFFDEITKHICSVQPRLDLCRHSGINGIDRRVVK